MTQLDPRRVETLGPAERILQALITYNDHMYHGRPGVVSEARGTPTGVRWQPVTHKVCLLYTSPSPRDATLSRMPSSA